MFYFVHSTCLNTNIIFAYAHTDFMINLLTCLIIMFVSYIPQPLFAQVCASASAHPIKTVEVSYYGNTGTATLYGQGENYITDLKVKVRFENNAPYEINLEDGYSPSIETFDFGAEDEFLFCSSQTGGSGGYGNYRVYRLKPDSYQLLFDDKINGAVHTFGATFQPDGFMLLEDNSTQSTLKVSVGYMDQTFYDRIFAPDGSVIGEPPYVNDISFVTPALNPATGIWRLMTYRSVAAVAEVNRLGYIVQTLDFDGDKFYPTFTEFSIAL